MLKSRRIDRGMHSLKFVTQINAISHHPIFTAPHPLKTERLQINALILFCLRKSENIFQLSKKTFFIFVPLRRNLS